MPFDGTNGTLAAKMREILNRGWCKLELRSNDGSHCLMGAFFVARGEFAGDGWPDYNVESYNRDPQLIALSETVATVSPIHKRLHARNHWSRVAKFNNDPATSFEDILKVLDAFEAKENAHVA